MRRPVPPSLIACRTFSAVSCAPQKNISGPTQKIDVEVLQAAKVWFGGRGRESLEELVRQGCVRRGVRNGGADLLRGGHTHHRRRTDGHRHTVVAHRRNRG